MNNDLISRQDAIDAARNAEVLISYDAEWPADVLVESVIEQTRDCERMAIESLPSADRPSIVRCGECKHRVYTEDGESDPHDIVCDYHMSDGFDEKDFCSYGERRRP